MFLKKQKKCVILYFNSRSAHMNGCIYQFGSLEDGSMSTIEIALADMPPDEDPTYILIEDEFVKEADDDDDDDDVLDRNNNPNLRLSQGGNSKEKEKKQKKDQDGNSNTGGDTIELGLGPISEEGGAMEDGYYETNQVDYYLLEGVPEEWIIDVMIPYATDPVCHFPGLLFGAVYAQCVPQEPRGNTHPAGHSRGQCLVCELWHSGSITIGPFVHGAKRGVRRGGPNVWEHFTKYCPTNGWGVG
jgi:hypothetical protein